MPCLSCGACVAPTDDKCPQCGAEVVATAEEGGFDLSTLEGETVAARLEPGPRATSPVKAGMSTTLLIGIGAAVVGAIGLVVVLVLVLRVDRKDAVVAKGDGTATETTVGKQGKATTRRIVANTATKEATPTEVWKEFTSPDGYLKATMPGEPVSDTPSDPREQQHMWAMETPTLVFIVQHAAAMEIVRPAGEAPYPPEEKLKNSASFIRVIEKDSMVVSERSGIKVGEFPAHEIVIKTPTKGVWRARLFIAYGRIYQAIVVGTAEGIASKNADRFLDSFATLKTMPDPAPPAPPPLLPMETLGQLKNRDDYLELPDGRVVAGYQLTTKHVGDAGLAAFDPNTDQAVITYDISLLIRRPDRVAVSADGSRIAAGSFDARRVIFFDAGTGKTLGVTELPFKQEKHDDLTMLAFMADGAGVVGTVGEHCFVARLGEKTATESMLSSKLSRLVAYAPGPDLIVAAIAKKTERVGITQLESDFELSFVSPTGKRVPAVIPLNASDQVSRVAITADGKHVAIGYGNREQMAMAVVTVADQKVTVLGPTGPKAEVGKKFECQSLAFAPDGERVVGAFSAGFNAKVAHVLLSRRTGEQLKAFQAIDPGAPTAVRFAPDGKTFRLNLYSSTAKAQPLPLVYDSATGNPFPTEALPTLHYQYKSGDQIKYILDVGMEIIGFKAKVLVGMRYDLTWRVTAVDKDGRATITVTFDAVRARTEGPNGVGEYDSVNPKPALDAAGQTVARSGTALLGKDLTLTIDARGRIESAQFSEALKKATADLPEGVTGLTSEYEIRRMLSQLMPVLPADGALGRRWADTREFPWQGLENDVTMTMITSYDAAGRRGANEKLVFTHALEAKSKAGSPVVVTIVEQVVGGTCLFDLATGRIRESTVASGLGIGIADGKDRDGFNIYTRATLREP